MTGSYSLFKVFFYFAYYIIYIKEDLFVGEAHHMVSHSLQVVLSDGVILLLLWLGMVSAVHLYDEAVMPGNEVYDIISYDVLSEEIGSQGVASQMFPEKLLCHGGFPSIPAGILAQHHVSVWRSTFV